MDENTNGGGPPLNERQLRVDKIDVRRHEQAAPTPITASFDLSVDSDEKPDITLERTGDGKWRFDVVVSGSRTAVIERAAPQLVRVPSRKLTAGLSRMKPGELAPSIPADSDDLAIRPRLSKELRRVRGFRDDRDVRPTTVFSPDGRWVFYDTRYPWRCLVRMTRPSGWSGPKLGLHSVDRDTFERTAKPSAAVYGAFVREARKSTLADSSSLTEP